MSYPPKYWAVVGDSDRAVKCLKEIGFWHLSGYDGCLCGNIKIFAFEIMASCRKSDNTITVSSAYLGVTHEDLQKVANEVARQFVENGDKRPDIILFLEP